ncbi:MAG: hypothetical protein D4R74_07735 [Betaproteobacteria bacterium]|nr:MAG: hypothetical protein D4R74_07735 [Betaproteobacteria bacterium]
MLISALALSLPGCATTSTGPYVEPGIARITPEELARLMPKPEPNLALAELIRLSKEGASTKDIIAKIRETGSRYDLSPSQVIQLHEAGVSTEVLDNMQASRAQELRDRLAEEINLREQRHADELQQERELLRGRYLYDPWWGGRPSFGWSYGYRFRTPGSIYWRR